MDKKQQYLKAVNEAWGSKEQQSSNKDKPDKTKDLPESALVQFDPNELKRLSKLKLTAAKQRTFLNLYSKFPNMAKCAKETGVSVTAIKNTIKRDPEFKAHMIECKENISESMKAAMVSVGSLNDARGANDRHRWLMAYDEDFKKQSDIQTNIQVNIESTGEVKSILSKILPND